MHAVSGPAVPSDYDDNPQRFLAWQAAEDVHEGVAERVARERLLPVLDLGCGDGRLARAMRQTSGWIGVDISTTLLALAPRPVVRGDGLHLPIRSNSIGAVAALWMLYHFAEPTLVIAEAHRILRPGGVFVACTSARDDAPELLPPANATSFDAEDAPAIVASVFGTVEVEPWDDQLVELRDSAELHRYLIQHLADPNLADGVEVPLRLTKRGCLVWARK
jgi:SAM-dependent methyltransferase